MALKIDHQELKTKLEIIELYTKSSVILMTLFSGAIIFNYKLRYSLPLVGFINTDLIFTFVLWAIIVAVAVNVIVQGVQVLGKALPKLASGLIVITEIPVWIAIIPFLLISAAVNYFKNNKSSAEDSQKKSSAKLTHLDYLIATAIVISFGFLISHSAQDYLLRAAKIRFEEVNLTLGEDSLKKIEANYKSINTSQDKFTIVWRDSDKTFILPSKLENSNDPKFPISIKSDDILSIKVASSN
jgi:hypothetical protein